MKKIIIITLISFLLSLVIFKMNYKPEFHLRTLGDSISLGTSFYNNHIYNYNDYLYDKLKNKKPNITYKTYYSKNNMTSLELLLKLKQNYQDYDESIIQYISKANILTIAIGMDEIQDYDHITYLNNIEEIFKIIRYYNHHDIYFISLFNTDNIKVNEINKELKNKCSKYNINYVDIEDIALNKKYIYKETYLTTKGHKYIGETIINRINYK